VRVDSVSKAFRGRPVLVDVSFALEAGEVLGLMGPNGSGKSTLLRILATTVLPDAGAVEIDGVDALSDPVRARGAVGVTLSDERAWYWRLTGRHNLEFFAALHGMKRRPAAAAAAELIERLDLVNAADRPFGEYSSGMRLRLSLARALLGRPRLLLLDEPTRSIDAAGAEEFYALLEDRVREHGAAAVIASHDADELHRLAGRGLQLTAGGPPAELAL
jgi:ABC-2 type transport system ATP-binding protein